MVPIGNHTIYINGNNVTITLRWREPFNNLDPIVNYAVSCSGDDACPPITMITNNTTRSYNFTNLTPITTYTFSVVAINSVGSGNPSDIMITTPGELVCICIMFLLLYSYSCVCYNACS